MAVLILQPPDSSICGHCCVAMATGVGLDQVIKFIGHEHGTRTKELVRAIRHFGLNCADRLHPLPKPKWMLGVEGKAIVIFRPTVTEIKHGHWTYLEDGKLYDPCQYNGDIEKTTRYKPTSYLKIY